MPENPPETNSSKIEKRLEDIEKALSAFQKSVDRQLHDLFEERRQDECQCISRMVTMTAVYVGLLFCGVGVVSNGAPEQVPYALVGLAALGTVFAVILFPNDKSRDKK